MPAAVLRVMAPPSACGIWSEPVVTVTVTVTVPPSVTGFGFTASSAVAVGKSSSSTRVCAEFAAPSV